MIEKIRKLNPNIHIYSIEDPEFNEFGRILEPELFSDAFSYLDMYTSVPEKNNIYIPNDTGLQQILQFNSRCHDVFGNMPLQYGYVNGHNTQLKALEYHKSSEINIANSPMILLLGKAEDIHDRLYDSSKLMAFFIPEKTILEIYPKTLHFSPLKLIETGFKCAVILPNGTNVDPVKSIYLNHNEDYYLFKTNKWLIAHPESKTLIAQGAHIGISGENIKIQYI